MIKFRPWSAPNTTTTTRAGASPPSSGKRSTPPHCQQERDAVIKGVRQAHIEKALHEAVTAGRLDPAEAARIFNRLARGGDPHALRRELRAAGVLTRSSANNKQDEGDSSA